MSKLKCGRYECILATEGPSDFFADLLTHSHVLVTAFSVICIFSEMVSLRKIQHRNQKQ